MTSLLEKEKDGNFEITKNNLGKISKRKLVKEWLETMLSTESSFSAKWWQVKDVMPYYDEFTNNKHKITEKSLIKLLNGIVEDNILNILQMKVIRLNRYKPRSYHYILCSRDSTKKRKLEHVDDDSVAQEGTVTEVCNKTNPTPQPRVTSSLPSPTVVSPPRSISQPTTTIPFIRNYSPCSPMTYSMFYGPYWIKRCQPMIAYPIIRDRSSEVPTNTIPKPPSYCKDLLQYIEETPTSFDFISVPRKNTIHSWLPDIDIIKNKQSDDEFRSYLVSICNKLQLHYLLYAQQLEVVSIILRHESYISGYPKIVYAPSSFLRLVWNRYQAEVRSNPANAPYVLKSKLNKNKIGYISKLEALFPMYLHTLYRHATSTLGVDENAVRLTQAMNSQSAVLCPHCPIHSNLGLNKHHFWKWFYSNGGKLRADTSKPWLSLEQKEERVAFATKWLNMLEADAQENDTSKKLYTSFLDKKWFYTST